MLMNCPYCSHEMEKGQLRSNGGVFFLPDGEKLPLLYTQQQMRRRNAVYLPPYMTSRPAEYPTAYLCRACSKITIDF